ncbi:unnamed protein product, partial [Owenia fusiformis]
MATVKRTIFVLAVSMAIGSLLALIFEFHFTYHPLQEYLIKEKPHWITYARWLIGRDIYQIREDSSVPQIQVVQESDYLTSEFKLLCVVMIHKEHLIHQGHNIQATWGRHCNHMIFHSNKNYDNLPVISNSGDPKSWENFRNVINTISQSYSQYKWVVFVDEDTYLIPENLRYYISVLEPTIPHYLGHVVERRSLFSGVYNTLDTGFVVNKQTLDLLQKCFKDGSSCSCPAPSSGGCDISLGSCLKLLGVEPKDTRDHLGRARFLPFTPEEHLTDSIRWTFTSWKNSFYPAKN